MRQYPTSDSKEVMFAKVRPGKCVVVGAVFLCAARTLFADTQHEHIVRELYRHAVQVPAPVVQVRALVHYIEPAWTEAQWGEYDRTVRKYGVQNPPEIAERWRKYLEQTHTSGIRWSLVRETKLPGFYRIDRKDYGKVEPIVDDRLLHSDDIFDQYFINNYGRKQLPFRKSWWDGQTYPAWANMGTRDKPQWEEIEPTRRNVVFIERGEKVSWHKLEDLFVARYLEAEAGFFLVMLLGKFDPATIKRLLNTPDDEHRHVIPPVPLDERKLSDSLSGTNPALKIDVVSSGDTAASVELSSNTPEGRLSVRYMVDWSLPYLVAKIRIVTSSGAEYASERSGLTDLGFPSHWRTERNTPDGRKTKEIRILSVTTNIVESAVLGTNYPAGATVYESVSKGQGKQNRVLVGNQPTGASQEPQAVAPTDISATAQAAPTASQVPAAEARGWTANRRFSAAVIAVMALAVVAIALILRKVATQR